MLLRRTFFEFLRIHGNKEPRIIVRIRRNNDLQMFVAPDQALHEQE
jgi:hypothetical protein